MLSSCDKWHIDSSDKSAFFSFPQFSVTQQKQMNLLVLSGLTATRVGESQSESSVWSSQIIFPFLPHFQTDKLSLAPTHFLFPAHLCPPQYLWKHLENMIDGEVQAEE